MLLVARDEGASLVLLLARERGDAREQRYRYPVPAPHDVRAIVTTGAVVYVYRADAAANAADAAALVPGPASASVQTVKVGSSSSTGHRARERHSLGERRVTRDAGDGIPDHPERLGRARLRFRRVSLHHTRRKVRGD